MRAGDLPEGKLPVGKLFCEGVVELISDYLSNVMGNPPKSLFKEGDLIKFSFLKRGTGFIPPFFKGGSGGIKNMLPRNRKLKQSARELRKNLTDAERKLWSKIRRKQLDGFLFYRQKVIGNYIVDFYCHQAGLVIEVDGGQHFTDEGVEKDKSRDVYLADLGLRMIRFNNLDVLKNCENVLQVILEYLSNVKKNPPVVPL